VTIRFARESDAAAMRAIYAPYVETTSISFEVDVPSVEEIAKRFNDTMPAFPWLVWQNGDGTAVDGSAGGTGSVLGYAYAHAFASRAAYQWSVETSIYIDRDAHRAGIGRALYTSLLALLRLQGFQQAFAGITLPNEKSVGLHEAMGFRAAATYQKVGFKFGMWHNVGWWQLALDDRLDAPPAIRSVNDLDPAEIKYALSLPPARPA
jgi:phosphinothricin acetyltransferase